MPFTKGHTAWNKGQTIKAEKVCKSCNKTFKVNLCRKNKAKYCSYECYWKSMPTNYCGDKSSNWKGGQYMKADGYILILNPSHPRANYHGYVRRSHLVMEKHLGRYLTKKEVVHHKGIKYPFGSIENKQDDRSENLQLFKNQGAHIKFHNKKS